MDAVNLYGSSVARLHSCGSFTGGYCSDDDRLSSRGLGMEKGIPTMILAASAIDDAVAVLIFSILLGVYLNGRNYFRA